MGFAITSCSMSDVLDALGIQYPQRNNFRISCPGCGKGNCTIALETKRFPKGCFHCFNCDESGDPFDFYKFYVGEKDNKKAFRMLKDSMGYRVSSDPSRNYSLPPENPIADIETRDKVYQALLDELSLADEHYDNLKNRGMTKREIKDGGYKSCPPPPRGVATVLLNKGYSLKGVPGFYINKYTERWSFILPGKGILIPARDVNGMIQGLQIRLDDATEGKYRWISSVNRMEGTESKVWCHYHPPVNGDNSEVYLTEGPLKADIIGYKTGKGVIAVPGVNSLTYLEETLNALKQRGTKKILIAYDMDFVWNAAVTKGLKRIKSIIESCGLEYEQITWNPHYKGYDDYLTSRASH